jgi:hypothetical protein
MKASDRSFPAQVSEHLPPAELARLYNTCAAGLVLSFTNMSLLPNELLACGAIPVINDSPITRPYLPNPHVQWSRPSPAALAQALADSVDRSHGGLDFAAVSGSVANARWSEAQDVVVAAVQRECWSPDSAQPSADAHSASSTAWLSGPQQ